MSAFHLNKQSNVVIIGFMGTGKSSSGEMLASRMGRKFVDTDKLIEEREGMRINTIFAEKGEDYFRDLETKTVAELSEKRRLVISTGGGIVKRHENMELLKKNGIVICLTADIDTILMRTEKKGERPVLDREDTGDRRSAIEKLIDERKELYEQADYSVDTSDRSPLEINEEILQILRRVGIVGA